MIAKVGICQGVIAKVGICQGVIAKVGICHGVIAKVGIWTDGLTDKHIIIPVRLYINFALSTVCSLKCVGCTKPSVMMMKAFLDLTRRRGELESFLFVCACWERGGGGVAVLICYQIKVPGTHC